MTITFPRDMPEPLAVRSCSFNPLYMQVRAPTRGGLTQVANVAPDLWEMKYETPPLREADAGVWHAWLQSLRGGARLFKATHPLRRYALGYPAGYGALTRAGGGGAFDGTCILFAIGEALDTVTLSTLPASFVLGAGDMLSFPFASGLGQTLHRVVEGATANGSGALTVTVEPTLPLAAATGVTVSLLAPWCKAVLDPKSVTGPWQVGRRSAVSFSAVQVY